MQLMKDSPPDYPLQARGMMRDLYDSGNELLMVVTGRVFYFQHSS